MVSCIKLAALLTLANFPKSGKTYTSVLITKLVAKRKLKTTHLHLPTKFYVLTPTRTRAIINHTFTRAPAWPQISKLNISGSSVQNVSGKKFSVNIRCHQVACQVSWPKDEPLKVVCNLKIFKESWVPKPEKSEYVKIDRVNIFRH